MKTKKISVIILLITTAFIACKKENTLSDITKPDLTTIDEYSTSTYQKKIEMRKQAQIILTEISTDRAVQEEILQTIDAITKKYPWRDEAVYFKEFLPNNYNTILKKNSIVAQKFNLMAYMMEHPSFEPSQSFLRAQTGPTGNSNTKLSLYLIDEEEEIYMPYHEDFTVVYNPTCTHQNLRLSETNNSGTIKINNVIYNRTVNDVYAQTNACWIVGTFDDNREVPTLPTQPAATNQVTETILDPTAVVWGYVKATDPHEGLFKGGPEFRLCATDVNIFGNPATAFPTTEIPVNMSRKESKNGTPKRQYISLDLSWELLEISKRVFVYEDDRDGIMGQILNLIFPIQVQLPLSGSTILNAGKGISNKDEDLGDLLYNRTHFYNNYKKNATLFQHGLDPDKWPWLAHGGNVWYSLPRLTN